MPHFLTCAFDTQPYLAKLRLNFCTQLNSYSCRHFQTSNLEHPHEIIKNSDDIIGVEIDYKLDLEKNRRGGGVPMYVTCLLKPD